MSSLEGFQVNEIKVSRDGVQFGDPEISSYDGFLVSEIKVYSPDGSLVSKTAVYTSEKNKPAQFSQGGPLVNKMEISSPDGCKVIKRDSSPSLGGLPVRDTDISLPDDLLMNKANSPGVSPCTESEMILPDEPPITSASLDGFIMNRPEPSSLGVSKDSVSETETSALIGCSVEEKKISKRIVDEFTLRWICSPGSCKDSKTVVCPPNISSCDESTVTEEDKSSASLATTGELTLLDYETPLAGDISFTETTMDLGDISVVSETEVPPQEDSPIRQLQRYTPDGSVANETEMSLSLSKASKTRLFLADTNPADLVAVSSTDGSPVNTSKSTVRQLSSRDGQNLNETATSPNATEILSPDSCLVDKRKISPLDGFPVRSAPDGSAFYDKDIVSPQVSQVSGTDVSYNSEVTNTDLSLRNDNVPNQDSERCISQDVISNNDCDERILFSQEISQHEDIDIISSGDFQVVKKSAVRDDTPIIMTEIYSTDGVPLSKDIAPPEFSSEIASTVDIRTKNIVLDEPLLKSYTSPLGRFSLMETGTPPQDNTQPDNIDILSSNTGTIKSDMYQPEISSFGVSQNNEREADSFNVDEREINSEIVSGGSTVFLVSQREAQDAIFNLSSDTFPKQITPELTISSEGSPCINVQDKTTIRNTQISSADGPHYTLPPDNTPCNNTQGLSPVDSARMPLLNGSSNHKMNIVSPETYAMTLVDDYTLKEIEMSSETCSTSSEMDVDVNDTDNLRCSPFSGVSSEQEINTAKGVAHCSGLAGIHDCLPTGCVTSVVAEHFSDVENIGALGVPSMQMALTPEEEAIDWRIVESRPSPTKESVSDPCWLELERSMSECDDVTLTFSGPDDLSGSEQSEHSEAEVPITTDEDEDEMRPWGNSPTRSCPDSAGKDSGFFERSTTSTKKTSILWRDERTESVPEKRARIGWDTQSLEGDIASCPHSLEILPDTGMQKGKLWRWIMSLLAMSKSVSPEGMKTWQWRFPEIPVSVLMMGVTTIFMFRVADNKRYLWMSSGADKSSL